MNKLIELIKSCKEGDSIIWDEANGEVFKIRIEKKYPKGWKPSDEKMTSKCKCGNESLNCFCGICHNCGEKFQPEDECRCVTGGHGGCVYCPIHSKQKKGCGKKLPTKKLKVRDSLVCNQYQLCDSCSPNQSPQNNVKMVVTPEGNQTLSDNYVLGKTENYYYESSIKFFIQRLKEKTKPFYWRRFLWPIIDKVFGPKLVKGKK